MRAFHSLFAPSLPSLPYSWCDSPSFLPSPTLSFAVSLSHCLAPRVAFLHSLSCSCSVSNLPFALSCFLSLSICPLPFSSQPGLHAFQIQSQCSILLLCLLWERRGRFRQVNGRFASGAIGYAMPSQHIYMDLHLMTAQILDVVAVCIC